MELPDTGSYGFLLPASQIQTVGQEVWAATGVVSSSVFLSVSLTTIGPIICHLLEDRDREDPLGQFPTSRLTVLCSAGQGGRQTRHRPGPRQGQRGDRGPEAGALVEELYCHLHPDLDL